MNIFSKKNILILSLVISVAVGFGIFENPTAKAEKRNNSAKSFSVVQSNDSAVNIEENISPWINMRQGKPINSEFVGTESAIEQFESGNLRPTTIVSADFNFDGFPDVISGFAGTNGGVITLHKGWKEAFSPEDEQVLAGIKNGEFPVSFEKDAQILDVPVAPDFIVAGRFVKGSTLDLIVGSRNSDSIYLLTSNGKSGFNAPRQIKVNGEVTAIAADVFNASKAYSGLVVAAKNDNGFEAIVFDGSDELNSTKPQRLQLSKQTDSLILTVPDGTTNEKDLFLLGGGELSRIPQIGKSISNPATIDLPFQVSDFATGEFIRDRLAKNEIAVLADNGSVYFLKNGSLDTRPFTEGEMRENFAKNGRGRNVVINSKDIESALANNWTIAEQQNLGVFNISRQNSQSLLRKSYITGNETEDLMVVNPSENKIQILFKEPNYDPERLSFTGETQIENLAFSSEIAAALPVRLNVMGQQGIAVLQNGKLEPTPVMFVPEATFTVSKTADTNDGTCNADCSVREAVVAANGAAGADMIVFTPNGNHQLTIAGANENTGATGDLDVTQSLTITGNGSANTFLQGGASVGTGVDKVLSINPAFTTAFATSIASVTVRFGRNQGTFAGDGFGGGFDWEGSGTGTLAVSGSVVTDNRTIDGDGGGITATNSTAGAGTFTVTNTTVSNNIPARSGATNSPVGGGFFVGQSTPYLVTGSVINNNNVNGSGGQGQGGGIFAFGPSGSGGTSFLTNTSVTNNAAPSDGGGVMTTQPININPTVTISNNSSGRFGGGLFVNHNAATTTISRATMVGNSATTTGSAIYLGTTPTANVLNMSFSRLIGNTGAGFTGLATAGGTATIENNWWGCNTGPSAAPCNTAGVAGGGTVDFDPWLQLRITASPTTVVTGQTSALTASFLTNSAGTTVAASNLSVLIGLPISFGATGGTISLADSSDDLIPLADATIQATGTAAAIFTATSVGARTATATVDGATATANITVNQAATTTTITGQSMTTTTTLQTFTVFYSVVVNSPGAGSPTGTVTVTDGVNSCNGTVAAGQCNIQLTTTGTRTLIATYNGDTNYASDASPGVTHTVLGPVASSVTISGRVLTADGSGIYRAKVTLTDSNGLTRTATTNSFGYYRLQGIEVGNVYTISAIHKEYSFVPQVISVSDEIADLQIIAQQ